MSPQSDSPSDVQPTRCAERIDRLCLLFEDAWQSGGVPQISDFLKDWQGEERARLLRELLLVDIEYVRRGGCEPTAEAYFERFPEDRMLVAELFGMRIADEATELNPGQRVGRYVIERLLGSGSFGRVYLAWDSELARMVALKAPLAGSDGETQHLDEFIEEARTASKIDHPAIVPVLDVVRDPSGAPMMVMPYVEGCSLRERMIEQRLTRLDAVALLIEVADAMDYAHRRGFVHRDLKPRNILLDSHGRPHITDFGLALHESTQRARAGESAGSLAYMSPEQLRGEAQWLDGRSDIWALGVILYELLAGRRPFGGSNADELASEIFARDPKPLRQIEEGIPVELERICLTCLSKPISGRFATGRDLADALRRVMPSLRPDSKPPPEAEESDIQPSAARSIARSLLLVGGLASTAMAAALLAVAVSKVGWISTASPDVALPDVSLPEVSLPDVIVHDIELTVWSQHDKPRGRINRSNRTASPLHTLDKVRLDIVLNRPAYSYVLWIGIDGDVTPIYPWLHGKWNRPAVESAAGRLSLPAESNGTWKVMPGNAGAESIVVLAAQRPLPADLDFPVLLARMQSQLDISLTEPLWFDNGRLLPSHSSILRSPDVSQLARLDSPLISNQLLIADKIGRHCTTMHALCFPLSGSQDNAVNVPAIHASGSFLLAAPRQHLAN